MPVVRFDYAFLASVNEKGKQVRMRTILDTITGYGTACVIDVKGGGDKHVISFCGVVLERIGVHTISMQDGSRACDHGNGGCGHQVFVR